MNSKANQFGTVRSIADLILNGHERYDDIHVNKWLHLDTEDEHAKAMTAYNKKRKDLSGGGLIPAKQLDEIDTATWELVSATEQQAMEKGMKEGARLIMELLGGCRMSH